MTGYDLTTNKTPWIVKYFSLIVFLLPVFSMYSVGGVVDLDVVLMAIAFLVYIFSKKKITFARDNWSIIFLILYTVIVTLCNLFFGRLFATSSEIVLRMGRYCLYLFIVLFMFLDEFKYEEAMKIYRVIVYLAFIYIVVQAVFYYGAGITLPNKIGFTAKGIEANAEEMGRLRAFYSEPADMAYSVIPFIVCSLFGPAYTKKDTRFRDAILITVAVLITTSGQGTICVGVIWLIWMVISIRKGESLKKTFFTFICIALMILMFYSVGLLDYSIGRATNTSEFGAVNARMGGYKAWSMLGIFQWIFGYGYGNYITLNTYGLDVPYANVNYSSLAEYVFTTGIMGTLLMMCILFKGFRKGDIRVKVLIIAMCVLSFGGCPFTGKYLAMYFILIFCK